MRTNFETLPDLLRTIIAKYLGDPSKFNFMDTDNQLWIKIHNKFYLIKIFIVDQRQFSQKIKSINDSHDLWVAYEFNRRIGEIFLDAYKSVQGIQLDFKYRDGEIFVLQFSVELKKPNTIFNISEADYDEWINTKLSGDYGRLYKIIKQLSPVDMSTLTHKSRFIETAKRKEFLQTMINENLIIEDVIAITKKKKSIFSINENKVMEDVVLMPDMPEGFRFEMDDTPMPDRFYEVHEKEKIVKDKISKQKETRHHMSERNANFYETTMMQALFKIAGEAIGHIHKLFPKLEYVVKITVESGVYDVIEFKAKKHTLAADEYFTEGFPEHLKEFIMRTPYKPFVYGYFEYIRANHSDFKQASLYDGRHTVNSKDVYVEIDFVESSIHNTLDILDSLPEKIEYYFDNLEKP